MKVVFERYVDRLFLAFRLLGRHKEIRLRGAAALYWRYEVKPKVMKAACFTGPNDGFLLNALKTLFRLSKVLLGL